MSRKPTQADHDHAAFAVWIPLARRVERDEYDGVRLDDLVSISTGGAPFWVRPTTETLDLAIVLNREAFDAEAQAITARCVIGGWGDQADLRASMEMGSRRFKALLHAEKSIRHLARQRVTGWRAEAATDSQVDYILGLVDQRNVEGGLADRVATAACLGVTKGDAADLIPLLQEQPAWSTSSADYDDVDYDHPHDNEIGFQPY